MSDTLSPLDPFKKTARRISRRYKNKLPKQIGTVSHPSLGSAETPPRVSIPGRKIRVPIFIAMGIIILLIVLSALLFGDRHPPEARFLDEEGFSLQGTLYFDEEQIGETDGIFRDLPDSYCRGRHTLRLRSGEKDYAWNTYPLDCRLDQVNFTITSSTIPRPSFVAWTFVGQDGVPVKGELFVDGDPYASINQPLTVLKDFCESSSVIELRTASENLTWEIAPESCARDEIRFTVN